MPKRIDAWEMDDSTLCVVYKLDDLALLGTIRSNTFNEYPKGRGAYRISEKRKLLADYYRRARVINGEHFPFFCQVRSAMSKILVGE